MAQHTGCNDFTLAEWRADPANALRIQQIESECESLVTGLDGVLCDPPSIDFTGENAVQWIEERARGGCKVIAIDPISSLDKERPWIEDKTFMKKCNVVSRQHECCIVLVNHFAKDGAKMEGGAALRRNVDVILEFSALKPTEEFDVINPTYPAVTEVKEVDRIITIQKGRVGPISGLHLAYEFDIKHLECHELGIIRNKSRK
jgi:hypothetical protein